MFLKFTVALSIVFVSFFSAGCSKGVAVDESARAWVRVAAVTAEPMSFQVSLNGNIERLLTPSASIFSLPIEVPYTDSGTAIPVKIDQLPSQRAVANINFKPILGTKTTHYLTIFQPKAGDMPFLVLPDSVSAPATGYVKMQFTYSEDTWPASIKLRLYKASSTNAFDSCMVARFKFSNWGNISADRSDYIYYDILDASTGQAVVTRRAFPVGPGDVSEDYNIYQLAKDGFAISFNRLY